MNLDDHPKLETPKAEALQSEHRERMSRLVESFPSLREAPGVRPWDAIRFACWLAMQDADAEYQQHAGAFALSVWHGRSTGTLWFHEENGIELFDPVHAMAYWDAQHKDAFIAWCQDPFWP